MDKGWPSIWKSCKIRVRPERQRMERPNLNLDAVKISLQCPAFRCKLKGKQSIHLNRIEPKSESSCVIEEIPNITEQDLLQLDCKQVTKRPDQKDASSFDSSKLLAVSSISNYDESKENINRETRRWSNNCSNGDYAKVVGTNGIWSQGKISPRKIYLGGGFYNAIAIYDRNANIDIIKVGETRLGFMDCIINKKEKGSKKGQNNCLPRLQTTLEVDGLRFMPEELKCGKIFEKVVKTKRTPSSCSTCKVCRETRKTTCDTVGPKQIKLFLSIDL